MLSRTLISTLSLLLQQMIRASTVVLGVFGFPRSAFGQLGVNFQSPAFKHCCSEGGLARTGKTQRIYPERLPLLNDFVHGWIFVIERAETLVGGRGLFTRKAMEMKLLLICKLEFPLICSSHGYNDEHH